MVTKPGEICLTCEGSGIAHEDAMEVHECSDCGGHGLLGNATLGYTPIAVLRRIGDDKLADRLMQERAPYIARALSAAAERDAMLRHAQEAQARLADDPVEAARLAEVVEVLEENLRQ